MDALMSDFLLLGGFGALIAIIVNLAKRFSLVQDGGAQQLSTALSLLTMVVLFVLRSFGVELMTYDAQAGSLAQILQAVGEFAVLVIAARQTHSSVKNVPMIGYSFSAKKLREYDSALGIN